MQNNVLLKIFCCFIFICLNSVIVKEGYPQPVTKKEHLCFPGAELVFVPASNSPTIHLESPGRFANTRKGKWSMEGRKVKIFDFSEYGYYLFDGTNKDAGPDIKKPLLGIRVETNIKFDIKFYYNLKSKCMDFEIRYAGNSELTTSLDVNGAHPILTVTSRQSVSPIKLYLQKVGLPNWRTLYVVYQKARYGLKYTENQEPFVEIYSSNGGLIQDKKLMLEIDDLKYNCSISNYNQICLIEKPIFFVDCNQTLAYLSNKIDSLIKKCPDPSYLIFYATDHNKCNVNQIKFSQNIDEVMFEKCIQPNQAVYYASIINRIKLYFGNEFVREFTLVSQFASELEQVKIILPAYGITSKIKFKNYADF